MTLSLDSQWVADMVTGATVQVYVEFDATPIAGGADRTVRLCRAKEQMFYSSPVPNIISGIGSIAYSVDPLTRKPSYGQIDIEVSDTGEGSYIRTLLKNYYVKGRTITLSFGPDTVNPSAFAPLWGGVIEDFIPHHGSMSIRCKGATSIASRTKRAGLWSAKHPKEIALEALTAGGVPTGLRDDSSFDYDDDTTISHLAMCRSGFSYTAGLADPDQVSATGAIAASSVKQWTMSGVCERNTSNGGRIYVDVDAFNIASANSANTKYIYVKLYSNYTGGELVGDGQRRINTTTLVDGQYIDVPILAPHPAGPGQLLDYGITGNVKVQYNAGSPITIAIASTSYLTMSAVQYGTELKCSEVAETVARQCGSTIIEGEDGKMKWTRFDPATAVVAHWDDQIALKPNVDQTATIGNIINKVRIEQTFDFPTPLDSDLIQRVGNYRSERADSITGHNGQEWEHDQKSEWCVSIGVLTADLTATATSFTVGRIDDDDYRWAAYVNNHGMCGAGGPAVGGSQAANRKADNSTRFCYLLIGSEIVKVGTTAISALGDAFSVYDPIADGTQTVYNSVQIACSNVLRAQAGTGVLDDSIGVEVGVEADKGAEVKDITLAYILAESILDRFESGCPIIRLDTDLRQHEVQVCDLVTIADSLVCGYGVDGVTSTTKWEAIKKEIDIDAKRIRWTLARVAPASTTDSTVDTDLDPWRRERPGDRAPLGHGVLSDVGLEAGSVMIAGESSTVGDPGVFSCDVSNKRVGIGTHAPSVSLHIDGNGSSCSMYLDANDARLYAGAADPGGGEYAYMGTPGAQNFQLRSNSATRVFLGGDATYAGRVGIGTNTPSTAVHIYNSSSRPELRIDDATGGVRITTNASNEPTISSIGDKALHFLNKDAGQTAMYISSDTDGGNVGIGTDNTSPARKLDVRDSGACIIGVSSTGTGDSAIKIGEQGSGNRSVYIDLVNDSTYTGFGMRIIRNDTGANANCAVLTRGTGDFNIGTTEAGDLGIVTTGTARIKVLSGGNVGIGDNDPDSKLEVAGAITIQEMADPGNAASGKCVLWLDSTSGQLSVRNDSKLEALTTF